MLLVSVIERQGGEAEMFAGGANSASSVVVGAGFGVIVIAQGGECIAPRLAIAVRCPVMNRRSAVRSGWVTAAMSPLAALVSSPTAVRSRHVSAGGIS